MKSVALPSGERVPALGLGTWNIGDSDATRAEEIACSRDGLFLVSKVLPDNASCRGTITACEKSLTRLGTDRLDLYLLHWLGGVPFAETLEALAKLKADGKIRHYGVSNLDLADMEEWWPLTGGDATVCNQLLYNLSRRGIEYDLLPWLRNRRVPVMAYSPLEQARLVSNKCLAEFSRRHGMTPAQAALAWLLAKDDVIVIPKSGSRVRMQENIGALEHPLDAAQLAELDAIFPPPKLAKPLEML